MNEREILKLIVAKAVDVSWLLRSANVSKYNLGIGYNQHLKQNEYKAIKLKCLELRKEIENER